VGEIVERYWRANGGEIKAYRDLGQHHAVLCSEVRVRVDVDGSKTVFAALPDVPHEKSLRNVQYTPPYVQAGPYCRSQALALFEFLYRLMYALLRYLGHPESATMVVGYKAAVHMGSIEGYYAPVHGSLEEVLWQIRESSKEASQQALGALQDPPLVFRSA
jgi:hypothetical protein